jgi:hypothetical protein
MVDKVRSDREKVKHGEKVKYGAVKKLAFDASRSFVLR